MLTLEIDNPARANALTATILDDLILALSPPEIGAVRAAVLIGVGERHFSSGVDLSSVDAEGLPDHIRGEEARLGRAAAAIEESPVPVLAAVNGAAFGGALELAAACDWRISCPAARLGMPAVRIGVAYSFTGLERFVRLLGAARTRRLFFSAEPVGGEEGFALGLVDQLVSDGDVARAAREAAEQVAAASPMAIRATRAALSSFGSVVDRDNAVRRADLARAEVFASDDFREGLAAFREKRSTRFNDR